MVRPFRFAIISDPHVTLPHTLRDLPNRFHLMEASIPVLEHILQALEAQTLDFLLLPGDLTQHGELENHQWLVNRLQALPFPVYVVPGNHDIILRDGCDRTLSLQDFPTCYGAFGYDHKAPYYQQELLPGIHLIGLNSIAFDPEGTQQSRGSVDETQLTWLSEQLEALRGAWVMVMIHHNVLEHLPGQAQHPMGQRYILQNREALIQRLQAGGVNLLFTGHLHIQDIAQEGALWEITTGSLVSYPHPYRILTATPQPTGQLQVQVETFRVPAAVGWPDLQAHSLQWMRDRADLFMLKLLTCPPCGLPLDKAKQFAPELQDFWASISAGDPNFDFPQLPEAVNQYLRAFGAVDQDGHYCPIDNDTTLMLPGPVGLASGLKP
ncbi:MAG: metallophosphoesterase [Leptolyngbya sp. SIO1E4]|nr:metallophosphoesterase [Leptolyngbya sp. SIO1E4]